MNSFWQKIFNYAINNNANCGIIALGNVPILWQIQKMNLPVTEKTNNRYKLSNVYDKII